MEEEEQEIEEEEEGEKVNTLNGAGKVRVGGSHWFSWVDWT